MPSWWRNASSGEKLIASLTAIVIVVGVPTAIVALRSPELASTPLPKSKTLAGGGGGKSDCAQLPAYVDELPQTNESNGVKLGLVSIGGKKDPHGLQFEIDAEAAEKQTITSTYAIPKCAHAFTAAIGNDDNQQESEWENTALLYQVSVDGRRVAEGHVHGRVAESPLTVNVTGHRTLELTISVLGGCCDPHQSVDWAEPVFT